jgi:hypothetical protein
LVAAGLLSIASAHADQTAVEQSARQAASALASAQGMILQIPDLYARNQQLEAQVKDLEAKLKALTPAEPTKP